MVCIHIPIKLVLVLVLTVSLRCCRANVDISNDMDLGWSCESSTSDNSTTAGFKADLDNLLTTLQEKGPQNYGFYANETGKIYGLVQCMGDISATDCSTCLKDSIQWAREHCQNSSDVAVWLKQCFLHYSDEDFFGQWNSSTAVLLPNNTGLTDSPGVVVFGQNLLHQLSDAVPDQPLLFKTGSVDVGTNGTRYGLVQCNRDLNKSSCGYCIDDMLEFYFPVIGNQSSYMVFSYGCRMWYDSYKFYFNDTVPSFLPKAPPMPTDSGMQLPLSFGLTVAALISLFVTASAL